MNYNELYHPLWTLVKEIPIVEVWDKYFDINEIGKKYSSPFREDKHPSFVLNKNGLGYDLSLGTTHNIFEELSKIQDTTFDNMLTNILNDIPLDVIEHQQKERVKKKIKIRSQPFDNVDLLYWNEYGITLDILNMYFVKRVSYYLIENGSNTVIRPRHRTYAYCIRDEIKLYCPNPKDFISTSVYPEGYEQLDEKGDLVVITKSYKDVMFFRTMGINAIAAHCEGKMLEAHIIEELKQRFKKVIVFCDNDKAGKTLGLKYNKEHKLPFVWLDDYKDPTDCYKATKDKQIIYNKLHE